MERRLTAFLLPVIVAVLGFMLVFTSSKGDEKPAPDEHTLPAAARSAVPPASPPGGARAPATILQDAAPNIVPIQFGEIGERGAMWVEFDRRAASVRRIRLLDQPTSAEARSDGLDQLDQCYPIVEPLQEGLRSLALLEAEPEQPRFAVDLFSAWQMRKLADGGVTFTLVDEKTGLTLEKTYHGEPERRGLRIDVRLLAAAGRGATAQPAAGAVCPLQMRGLSLVNPKSEHVLRQNPAIGIALMSDPESIEVVRPDGKPNPAVRPVFAAANRQTHIVFAGTTNRFFAGLLEPANEAAVAGLRRVELEKWPDRSPLPDHDLFSVPVALYQLGLPVPAAGESSDLAFDLYVGPKSAGVFDENEAFAPFFHVMDVDLRPMCCFPGLTIPGTTSMAKGLLWVLRLLQSVVGNWGVAIMLLTILVRGALVPLNFRMQKSMRAFGAKAARLKPKMDQIKEQYSKDPKRMQQELVAFQREHKMFPPIGGCLPLLVTIPVFLGLFTSLRVAYELRHQPFLAWITDLSQPDQLFQVGLPFMPYFNLLPILMVVLWIVLQLGTPLPSDPQQRQVTKIMRFMPLLFGVMLYNYASGLMVYMVTSSLFGIAEQRVTKRVLGPAPTEGGMSVPTF